MDNDFTTDEYERTCYVCGAALPPSTPSLHDVCASCAAEALRVLDAQVAYDREWPHACQGCGGAGLLYDPGVWRYPDGSGQPPSWEVCDSCLAVGRCPRCSAESFADEDLWDLIGGPEEVPTCAACGWSARQGGRPDF